MRENRAMPFASKGLWEDKTGAGLGSCFLANPRGGALVKMYRYKGPYSILVQKIWVTKLQITCNKNYDKKAQFDACSNENSFPLTKKLLYCKFNAEKELTIRNLCQFSGVIFKRS